MTAEKEILIWAKTLYSLSEGKSAEEQKMIMKKLAEILEKKRKLYLLPKIVKKLEKIYFGAKKAELFLAREHSQATINGIKEKLFPIIGKEKNVEVRIEKELIGGFRAKTNNLLIKASIKDFLDELKLTVN